MLSGQQPGSFCPVPVAPESLAAKATASVCAAGSVSPSLAPRTRLATYLPLWQTQVQIRSPRPNSSEPTSMPLPLSAGLARHCRNQLPLQQRQTDSSPQLLCCPLARQSSQPAWSVPAPWQDDRHTPRWRMLEQGPRPHIRACPHTTAAAPPSRRSPTRERQDRREYHGISHHPFFATAHRG